MLEDKHPLVCLCTQLSKLKFINQQPTALAANRFYSMAQEMMTKASLEAIYLGVVLILGGILVILGGNYNNNISGIPNEIPSPSRTRSVIKKYREAKFMRTTGFVRKYS